ncbi:MAG: GGDEF domain-containing protein, partial [bacterium]
NFLVSVIGHVIYYFDFTTFKNERKLQKQQQRIRELANYDQLTGLLNRNRFEERAKKIIEGGNRYDFPVTMAMLDLDDFKKINDLFGHSAGDRVLEKTGMIVQDELRDPDLACRYGGEEFCVLMPETDLESASEPANRIRGRLASVEFNTDSEKTFSVTCSIGLAEQPDQLESLEELYRKADEALYDAKLLGGNCLVDYE